MCSCICCCATINSTYGSKCLRVQERVWSQENPKNRKYFCGKNSSRFISCTFLPVTEQSIVVNCRYISKQWMRECNNAEIKRKYVGAAEQPTAKRAAAVATNCAPYMYALVYITHCLLRWLALPSAGGKYYRSALKILAMPFACQLRSVWADLLLLLLWFRVA